MCKSACMCSRRAQRKFRERQRTRLQDSESKIAELSQHVEQLRLRMAELERANAALQAAGAPRALDAPAPSGPFHVAEPWPQPADGCRRGAQARAGGCAPGAWLAGLARRVCCSEPGRQHHVPLPRRAPAHRC